MEQESSIPKVTIDQPFPIAGTEHLGKGPVRGLKPKQFLICHLAALALKQDDIARMVGTTQQAVSLFLQTEEAQAEVERAQDKLWGGSFRDMIQKIAPSAFQTAVEIMTSPAAKASTRLAAAQDLMDRSIGKPVQQVDVGSNLLRLMLERMDAEAREKTEPRVIESTQESLTPTPDAVTVKLDEPQLDAADAWVKENL